LSDVWFAAEQENSGRCVNATRDRTGIDLNEEAALGPLSLCYNMDNVIGN